MYLKYKIKGEIAFNRHRSDALHLDTVTQTSSSNQFLACGNLCR